MPFQNSVRQHPKTAFGVVLHQVWRLPIALLIFVTVIGWLSKLACDHFLSERTYIDQQHTHPIDLWSECARVKFFT